MPEEEIQKTYAFADENTGLTFLVAIPKDTLEGEAGKLVDKGLALLLPPLIQELSHMLAGLTYLSIADPDAAERLYKIMSTKLAEIREAGQVLTKE